MSREANRAERIEAHNAEEAQVVRLPAEDQRRFAELLLNPPALAPAMKRAQKAHARLIGSQPAASPAASL